MTSGDAARTTSSVGPRDMSSLWPDPTEDRRRLSVLGTWAVGLLLGLSFRTALSTMALSADATLLIDASSLTAVVAVLLLRSIRLRTLVRTYATIGGLLMVRFGWLSEDRRVAAASVFTWAACVALALALCPSPLRGSVQASTPLPTPLPRPDARPGSPSGVPSPGRRSGGRIAAATARGLVVAATAVVAFAAVVGPFGGRTAETALSNGSAADPSDRGAGNALSAQPVLDMTTRPRLSDAVVMTVGSDVESFWRASTYDRWNGSAWSQSDAGAVQVVPPDGRIIAPPEDLAALSGRRSTQVFRLQGRFANVLPTAASAVSVQSATALYQRPDGTLIAPDPLGKGAVYTVQSRQAAVTDDVLDAAGSAVPDAVRSRYARPPSTTDRVEALAREVTRSADTQAAKVRALESWMGRNLTYSLDAPLSPRGVDVVDDFLFRSKEGWCEQIASSLVVMLRVVGVPARLATGFAPGELDRGTGRFVVRERDAHAWAEVWFQGVGWVPFDPTASVPLSGDAAASASADPVSDRLLAVGMVFVAVVAAGAAPLARLLHARRTRWAAARARRRLATQRWDVRVERELEALGVEVGRPRAPSETVSAHARELAAVTGRPEVAEQGRAVDDHRYGPPGG